MYCTHHINLIKLNCIRIYHCSFAKLNLFIYLFNIAYILCYRVFIFLLWWMVMSLYLDIFILFSFFIVPQQIVSIKHNGLLI
jgi:hypothetical protein